MADICICVADGCCKVVIARGMCTKHYQQWRKVAEPDTFGARAKPGEPAQWIRDHIAYEGDECLIWPFGYYSTGYGALNLAEGGSVVASRQMCREKHGEPDDDAMQAAHTCGNGHNGCTNPNHVYWATRGTNEADKVEHGTSNRGSGNGHAKLDKTTVRAIRASGLGPTALANLLNISAATICDIRAKRSWAWLD